MVGDYMKDILKKMQETISKYAIVLSQVLKVDVEIVDDKLNRIAGTGMFKERINMNMSSEGYVIKKVIETGEKKIIQNPSMHPICIECPNKDSCQETFEVSTPIKLGHKVIGAIGFVCFTEKQKDHILENYNTFIEFLDQISDLIASKAIEVMENERNLAVIELFNNIIDKIEEGVIVFDTNYKISKINSIAKEMLKFPPDNNEITSIALKETGNEILNLTEYNLQINGESYDLAGKYFNINIGNYNKIFIFKDSNLIKENVLTLTASKEKIGLDRILGQSLPIRELKKKVEMIASSSSTVLINGESGTGKELFARALHEESDRANAPFVAINCAAIPDNLLESELFGYVKGAFTGADPKGKIGKFELAHNGTLFLDEIGDMPLYIQVKLLRALEEKEIVKLGSNKSIKVNVRVIAATNKNLDEMIINNSFREDLYYRLNVIPLQIPPLREREGDIRLLTSSFISRFSRLFNKNVVKIEDEFWSYIEKYPWQGNVRELQNTIEYVINMLEYPGVINTKLLPKKIKNVSMNLEFEDLNLEQMEKKIINKAIEIYGDDGDSKKIIAEKLGIGIATLYRKLKKYGL
ncbi:sigma-54 interaction domain-containing protein [Wukongibacter baidiensis]